jgi:hypothetical protein
MVTLCRIISRDALLLVAHYGLISLEYSKYGTVMKGGADRAVNRLHNEDGCNRLPNLFPVPKRHLVTTSPVVIALLGEDRCVSLVKLIAIRMFPNLSYICFLRASH